jgi:protoporphyrinogen oxidase
MAASRVAVVGGGLAGLSAALELKHAGFEVTLLERSRLLGGKATSFEIDGVEVDNGQHVFLACCTEFIDFVEQATGRNPLILQDRFDALLLARGKPPARLRAVPLPAPFHLAPALLRYGHLSLPDRLRIGRAMLSAGRAPRHGETFADWLARHGQRNGSRAAFWDPFLVPALNAPLEEVSAEDALFVIRTAFLETAGGARFGYSRVPLARIAESAATQVDDVIMRTTIAGIESQDEPQVASRRSQDESQVASRKLQDESEDESQVASHKSQVASHKSEMFPPGTNDELRKTNNLIRLVTSSGRQIPCAGVVLAVPPDRLKRLLGDPARYGIAGLDDFKTAPIVDVHLWYDVPSIGFDFAALLDSPIQWVFEKGAGYVCCSMSAADAYVSRPKADLVELCHRELTEMVPALAGATLLRGSATRDRDATFVPVPGLRRPGPLTLNPRVVIAGGWTNTGWPATMESAVRSGRAAARALAVQLCP